MKGCTDCVLEALFLLIFEAEDGDSQWRMREVSSSKAKGDLLRRNGDRSIVYRQWCKEILGLSNQLTS